MIEPAPGKPPAAKLRLVLPGVGRYGETDLAAHVLPAGGGWTYPTWTHPSRHEPLGLRVETPAGEVQTWPAR